MKRYPKIRYPGEKETQGLLVDGTVYAQEKLDGGNARFTLEKNLDEQFHTEDRDIAFGTRNNVYKNQKDETKQFADCLQFVRDSVNLELFRWYDDSYGGIVIFGEYMEPHTIQDYNWDKWKGTFVGYDVWSIGSQEFLHPTDAVDLIEDIGLPTSPILSEIPVEEWNDGKTAFHTKGEWPEDDSWCPESSFGPTLAEGIVLKNPDTEVYAKLIRDSFKEKNEKTFGKPKKYQESGAEKLSYQYITNARIKKSAHKLIDEGEYDSLKMEMMKDLPTHVIRDMAEEEGGNIFMEENYDVDLGEFRSITSGRCSNVLKQMINAQKKRAL